MRKCGVRWRNPQGVIWQIIHYSPNQAERAEVLAGYQLKACNIIHAPEYRTFRHRTKHITRVPRVPQVKVKVMVQDHCRRHKRSKIEIHIAMHIIYIDFALDSRCNLIKSCYNYYDQQAYSLLQLPCL